MRRILILALLTTLLAGCTADESMGSEVETIHEKYRLEYNETYIFQHALQIGHQSLVNHSLGNNSSMLYSFNVSYRFQDPIYAEPGHINITLISNESVLFSMEYTASSYTISNYSVVVQNMTLGDLTLKIESVGSDHTLMGGLQDFYEYECNIEYW